MSLDINTYNEKKKQKLYYRLIMDVYILVSIIAGIIISVFFLVCCAKKRQSALTRGGLMRDLSARYEDMPTSNAINLSSSTSEQVHVTPFNLNGASATHQAESQLTTFGQIQPLCVRQQRVAPAISSSNPQSSAAKEPLGPRLSLPLPPVPSEGYRSKRSLSEKEQWVPIKLPANHETPLSPAIAQRHRSGTVPASLKPRGPKSNAGLAPQPPCSPKWSVNISDSSSSRFQPLSYTRGDTSLQPIASAMRIPFDTSNENRFRADVTTRANHNGIEVFGRNKPTSMSVRHDRSSRRPATSSIQSNGVQKCSPKWSDNMSFSSSSRFQPLPYTPGDTSLKPFGSGVEVFGRNKPTSMSVRHDRSSRRPATSSIQSNGVQSGRIAVTPPRSRFKEELNNRLSTKSACSTSSGASFIDSHARPMRATGHYMPPQHGPEADCREKGVEDPTSNAIYFTLEPPSDNDVDGD